MKNKLDFFQSESAGGVVLLLMTLVAFFLSNSSQEIAFFQFRQSEIFGWSLEHFVNDGLMVIFFFVIGLEIKREVLVGELKDIKNSSLALFGALGGMIVPAVIYYVINQHGDLEKHGWAIPMATDIAFALGILSLLGKRVPPSLKIFLMALAIIDDLGAILVIAFFYTSEIHFSFLILTLVPLIAIYVMNRFQSKMQMVYLILGVLTWYCILRSGVHATIAGVLLAFLMPLGTLQYWIDRLHGHVAFIIMPMFALFNAGVSVSGVEWGDLIHQSVPVGVVLGLLVGKPLGICLFSFLACKMNWARLAQDNRWRFMIGASLISGIGFTMSLFINNLSFAGTELDDFAKIGILIGSLIAAILGYAFLAFVLPKNQAAA